MTRQLSSVIGGILATTMLHGQPDASSSGHVVFQGSLRSRVETWNWFESNTGTNTYGLSGNLLRLSASKSAEKADWQMEFAVPFLLGLPQAAVAPGAQGQMGLGATYYVVNHQSQNAAMIFPKQVFYRWKNLGGRKGQSLRVGRFEFGDGTEHSPGNATLAAIKRDHVNQRLIGTFGFTHIGRSFDGVQYTFDRPANNFTFAAATPTRGVFQTDGWGWNRIGFAYAAYTHEWGKGRHSAETRAFVIEYADWRPVVKTDNRPAAERANDLANLRIDTFGGHTLHAFAAASGTFDALAWGTVQTGRWGALPHRAYAFDVEAGFQPTGFPKLAFAKWKPWLRAGVSAGSGDANPDDNRHGTFFQLLLTPRPYARFPFFNMMNTQDRFGSLLLRPHARLTLSSEFHALRLSNRNDLWYLGGGAFQPWTFGFQGRSGGGARSFANLYDTQADIRVSRAVSLTGYFAYAQGLAVTRAIYPRDKDARFGFLELTYRF